MKRKTLRSKALLLVTGLFFALPGSAFAAVQITEIMYDLDGSDTNHEWVEITNTGSQAVDLSKYTFFEDDTNHRLTIVSSSALLPGGESAIVADSAAKFTADWPAYAGMLIDSAFSLSNTGETLAIKNEKGEILDAVSYSSSMGAAGEGSSLHRVGASFTDGLPTLGVYPDEIKKQIKKETPAKTSASKAKSTTKTKAGAKSTAIASSSATIAQPSTQGSASSMLPSLLALGGVIALGAVGVFFASNLNSKKKVTKSKADEFELE